MATSNESVVLKRVRKTLKTTDGCLGVRITNTIGLPDVIACVNGNFLGIEVKDDVEGSYQLTKAQKMRLRHIIEANGIACVVDKHNVGAFESFIEWLITSPKNTKHLNNWGFDKEEVLN